MIPAGRMHPRAVQSLMEYLKADISRAENERRPLEERWLRYHRYYKRIPEFETKTFPFYGASNVVPGVIATDVDILFSRLMGLYFGQRNLWSVKPLKPEMVEYASKLEEFLEWAQYNELGAYNAVADFTMEMCKLGTGILKQRYRREQKRVYNFRETERGVVESHSTVLIKDSPVLEHVSLWDFLVPASAIDIQGAPWCAETIRLTWAQLQNRIRHGIYQGYDRLQSWHAREKGHWIHQQLQRYDLFSSGLGDTIDCKEVWLDFDITGVDGPEALVCTIHIPSMTYLRIDYNPFFNQEYPFSAARFLRQEKRFYGIGLAEMLEHEQEEVTALRNQRIDNGTLANSTMFKARKGIGIKQDEPIFPGRWFLLDDLDDVQPMNMGQRFDSTVQNEMLAVNQGSRRTGVNDYVSGDFSPAMGYSTATVGVQQHKTAVQRFDQTLREGRAALGESGTRLLELYQQFNQHGKEYMAMGAEDGELVHQVLQFPLELIRMSVNVELTATDAENNRDLDIRNNTLLMQLLTQFYQQSLQAMTFVSNPMTPPPVKAVALQMMVGTQILLKRIFDSSGEQDTDRLLPEIQEMLGVRQQQLNSFGPPQLGGQGGMAGYAPQQGGIPMGGGNQGAAGFLPATAGAGGY